MSYDTEERTLTNKELAFPLSADDYKRIGEEAANISLDITSDEMQLKQIVSERKEIIAGKYGALSAKLKIIHDGKEVRMVDCVERKNFTLNKIEYLFNGIVIEERPMEYGERQTVIDFKSRAAGDHDLDDEGTVIEPPERVEVVKENNVVDGVFDVKEHDDEEVV